MTVAVPEVATAATGSAGNRVRIDGSTGSSASLATASMVRPILPVAFPVAKGAVPSGSHTAMESSMVSVVFCQVPRTR